MVGKDKAWQAELQLENGFSGFDVSLLFLVFLNILMHNEGLLTTFFCRYKSWPCNCTTVGSSAAAGLLSGGLASAHNRRNRNGDSVAG